jgi:hypothetical protein
MKPLQHPIIFLKEKIHRKNNQLLIKFDYDETLISLIRSMNSSLIELSGSDFNRKRD